MNREQRLCRVAEQDPDDKRANKAMRLLRTYYDNTYGWCLECDLMVVKYSQCCMNQNIPNDNINNLEL